MSNCPPFEMVVASFDDPIVTALRVEQEAKPAARSVCFEKSLRKAAPPQGAGRPGPLGR